MYNKIAYNVNLVDYATKNAPNAKTVLKCTMIIIIINRHIMYKMQKQLSIYSNLPPFPPKKNAHSQKKRGVGGKENIDLVSKM